MTRALALAIALLALTGAAALGAPKPKVTLNDIENEVMCVQCGTTLSVSEAPAADGERRFIERRIAQGMTKAQIKAALVAAYGRNVLAEPPSRGFDVTNWLVPVLLAILAAGVVATTARRWRRAGAVREQPDPELPEDDAKRLERDMASYDL
jgi:cytochrome c-type biogenesis protein CcmH